MAYSSEFVIGSLFPRTSSGQPNIIKPPSLVERQVNGQTVLVPIYGRSRNNERTRSLKTELDITTDPVKLNGASKFIENFYLDQITAKENKNSIFTGVFTSSVGKWTTQPRNKTMSTLQTIGYIGLGAEHAATNNSYWNSYGTNDDPEWTQINDKSNYDPKSQWLKYNKSNAVVSRYDKEALLENIDPNNLNPDLWYPSLLYTYGSPSLGTSYPGPVLMVEPGSMVNIRFNNKLSFPGLNQQQNQQATLIKNSTSGNSSSDGLGGTTSVNYHFHGAHTIPGGFGDNVVSRYTTGQSWTTQIPIPADHGQGSYWYHPHYHPSVNQQVYGGLSGFIQIGNPLSKVPAFQSVPRNLAVLKSIDLELDPAGQLRIGSNANLGGVANRMNMVTVNGEFQPVVDAGLGGWQSLTLSNQTNQAFYNIALINTSKDGKKTRLPLYIYGEDGHQYPQIRQVKSALGSLLNKQPTEYQQAANLLSLAPGKRIDLMIKIPEGATELASLYSFNDDRGNNYKIDNMGGYPDLSTDNTGLNLNNSAAGPLAIFNVTSGQKLQSEQELNLEIAAANQGIEIQNILPTTKPEDYDSAKVPNVDLFAKASNGEEFWKPIRKREFNWTKNVLVGPKEEWDGPTQAKLQEYSTLNNNSYPYQRYANLPLKNTTAKPNQVLLDDWLGYENPFLINDHVFPNGPLIITQLGTIEEWDLRNWSVNRPTKYIGHPFHIHINDYQVKDSDTELDEKRNLEDVTMLNSSGYDYIDWTTVVRDPATGQLSGTRLSQKPLKGDLVTIPDDIQYQAVTLNPGNPAQQKSTLGTWGANTQSIRMLFQDYLGTYVFHCHILPHEDAGMMQVLTVVDNTKDSWLVSAEGWSTTGDSVNLLRANDFKSFRLDLGNRSGERSERATVGDCTADFVQDIAIASSSQLGAGSVAIYDGAALQLGQSVRLSSVTPFTQSALAPWAFIEDFSGDGSRDLVTVGYSASNGAQVDLKNLTIKTWLTTDKARNWSEQFNIDPYDFVDHLGIKGAHDITPVADLSVSQTSVAMADVNLDNFQDFVFAYAINGGIRITVLDGAAVTLNYQTGTMEGGYFPDKNLLTDVIIKDQSLASLSKIVLTSGFNSYAQSPIENLVVTAQSAAASQQLTLRLNAGHFIATSNENTHAGHGDHAVVTGGNGTTAQVINLDPSGMPLILVDQQDLPQGTTAATPVISSVRGLGASLVGSNLVIAQGNDANGTPSNSNTLINNTQQLVISTTGLLSVNQDDLTGITTSQLNSTFSADQLVARNQLTALTYQAYAGESLWPSGQANLSAGILGQGKSASVLADTLITQPGYKEEVEQYYGGPLNNLSVSDLVSRASQSLYGRNASQSELASWQQRVNEGLNKTLIPLAMLQSTSGNDRYRVGFLSAIAQWNQLQWGTTANVIGSFGQGLKSDDVLYTKTDRLINDTGTLSSWDDAQRRFDLITAETSNALMGTPVSNTGFF